MIEDEPAGGAADFDFLVGDWRVRHECLIRCEWQQFDGTCSMRKMLGGRANVDDNSWTTSAGTYRALTVRTFDSERSSWSIFWLDSRWPTTFGPPVVGGFDGAHGMFFGHDQLDGRPIRVRFDWFVDSPDACRWEQAFSFDAGVTWETNWRMLFARAATPELMTIARFHACSRRAPGIGHAAEGVIDEREGSHDYGGGAFSERMASSERGE